MLLMQRPSAHLVAFTMDGLTLELTVTAHSAVVILAVRPRFLLKAEATAFKALEAKTEEAAAALLAREAPGG